MLKGLKDKLVCVSIYLAITAILYYIQAASPLDSIVPSPPRGDEISASIYRIVNNSHTKSFDFVQKVNSK